MAKAETQESPTDTVIADLSDANLNGADLSNTAPFPPAADPTPAIAPHVRGMNVLRAVDPQARVMWTMKGPKEEPDGKISQVLMRVGDQGRAFVILTSNAFGFTTYAETDLTAPE